MKVNIAGKPADAVAIYVGGRTGRQPRPGKLIMELVPCDEALPDVVASILKHLELFKQVEREPVAKERVLMVPGMLSSDEEVAST
jgi:dissimilatory sulfite reductase (desulfoviridin) alpha/beta subunit